MEHQFTVDTLTKSISLSFTARQFRIENPTEYYVYVNSTSSIPQTTKYDYIIQPYTIFTSPPIQAQNLAILVTGLSLNTGIVKVSAYSDVIGESTSVNLFAPRSDIVNNFSGYPFVIPDNEPSPITLPSVTTNSYERLNFIFDTGNGEIASGNRNMLGFCLRKTTLGTIQPLSMIGKYGGIYSLTPTAIPKTFEPEIQTYFNNPLSLNGVGSITVDCVQNDNDLENYTDNYQPSPYIVGTGGYELYLPANPPAIVLGVRLLPNIVSIPGSLTIKFQDYFNSDVDDYFYENTINFTLSNVIGEYVFKKKIVPVPKPGLIQFNFTNGGTPVVQSYKALVELTQL